MAIDENPVQKTAENEIAEWEDTHYSQTAFEEPFPFTGRTTYHVYPHPLNPGRRTKHRTIPGYSILYQTTSLKAIPKDVVKAGTKTPSPRWWRKLCKKPEPDWEQLRQDVDELDRQRGRTWSVYKPKREGTVFDLWKRPPAQKYRTVARGTRNDLAVKGKVDNESTWLKNSYQISLGESAQMMTVRHESIWKLRSAIEFEVDGIRMEWKGTKKIEDTSGKEKWKFFTRHCHLKLMAYPQKTAQAGIKCTEDNNSRAAEEANVPEVKGIRVAGLTRTPSELKLARLYIDWDALASIFGPEKLPSLEGLLIASCTVAQVIERKRRDKARIMLEILVEVADNASG